MVITGIAIHNVGILYDFKKYLVQVCEITDSISVVYGNLYEAIESKRVKEGFQKYVVSVRGVSVKFSKFAAVFMLIFMAAGSARAATVTFADFNSLTQNTGYIVTAGSSFSIDIIGLDFTELAGGTIDLGYDESVVAINSVAVDAQWDFLPDGGSDSGTNTWGTIGFDVFANSPASGDFRIATISFTALTTGTSFLNVLGSSQFFSTTTQLSSTIANANIDVVPVPSPGAIWLMLSGIGALCGYRRVKRS